MSAFHTLNDLRHTEILNGLQRDFEIWREKKLTDFVLVCRKQMDLTVSYQTLAESRFLDFPTLADW